MPKTKLKKTLNEKLKRKRSITCLAATGVLAVSACSGQLDADVEVVSPSEDGQAVAVAEGNQTVDAAQLGAFSAPGVVSGCAGTFTGTFAGDEGGTVAISIGENGQMTTSAYPGLRLSYGADGFINVASDDGSVQIGPGGITIDGESVVQMAPGGITVEGDDGEDIQINPGGITVDDGEGNTVVVDADGNVVVTPSGPTTAPSQDVLVGPGGVVVNDGNGIVVTSGTGAVGDDGLVSVVTDDGRVLTGTFDWATCTGSGTWTESGRNGTWLVAQDTTQVHLGDSSCAGATYVGGDGTVLVGPGGVAVTDQGVNVGNGSVKVTPNGVSIGAGEVQFDALCTSEAVGTGQTVVFDEVGDGVVVEQGDGFTSYGMSGDLLFAFNSSDVDPAATATIDAIIASVSERFPGSGIQILGHTDSVGTEGYNLELSQARAQSVAVAIASDERMAGATIETHGLGESSPVVANSNPDGSDNPAGRQQNRRVEVVVLTG